MPKEHDDTSPSVGETAVQRLARFRILASAVHADGALRAETEAHLTRYADLHGIPAAVRSAALNQPPTLEAADWDRAGDPLTVLREVLAACLADGVLRRGEREFVSRAGDALGLEPAEVRQQVAAARDHQFGSLSPTSGPAPPPRPQVGLGAVLRPAHAPTRKPDTSSELRVVLDDADRVYAPGEKMRGRVEVLCETPRRCSALTVTPVWEVIGSSRDPLPPLSTSDAGGGAQTLCSDVEWQPGVPHAYPFELPAPAGPLSYRGELLNLVWRLDARADVPLAFDPQASAGFSLVRGERPPAAPVPHTRPREWRRSEAFHSGLGLVSGAFVTAVGVVGTLGTTLGTQGPHPLLCCAVWPLALGPLALLLQARKLSARYAGFGVRSMTVNPSAKPVRPGGALRCAVQFTARWPLEVSSVVVRLLQQEVAPYQGDGSGPRRGAPYVERTVGQHALQLSGPRTVRRGETVTLDGELRVPPDAAPSFHIGVLKEFHVAWRCEASVTLRDGKVRTESLLVEVTPSE